MTDIAIPTIPGTPFEGGFFVDIITDGGKTYALVVAPKSEDDREYTWKQAVKRAKDCRAGGHDDWQLPSRRDALAMAEKLRPTGSKTPDAFRDGGDQAFIRDWYWTSAEVDASSGDAWLQSFRSGTQLYDTKDDRSRCRAVRKCPL